MWNKLLSSDPLLDSQIFASLVSKTGYFDWVAENLLTVLYQLTLLLEMMISSQYGMEEEKLVVK